MISGVFLFTYMVSVKVMKDGTEQNQDQVNFKVFETRKGADEFAKSLSSDIRTSMQFVPVE